MSKKIAVFMGAGASKAFGYLLTDKLLPRIKDDLARDLFSNDGATRQPLEKLNGDPTEAARKELQFGLETILPGWNLEASQLDEWARNGGSPELPAITDVLSLIDHSLLISYAPLSSRSFRQGTPQPSRNTRRMIELRTLLERAIFNELCEPKDPDRTISCDAALDGFVRWIIEQSKPDFPEQKSLGIISSNYDVAVECRLFNLYEDAYEDPQVAPAGSNGSKFFAGRKIEDDFDFGFAWRDASRDAIHLRPSKPLLRFYKLHGSLNWLRCEMCEQTYINTFAGIIAHQAFRDTEDEENTCYCGHAPLRTVIVAPSLVRDIRDANLLEVWKNTLELLRTADEWIIIGYSFPPEDIPIRSLFIRAYQGRWRCVDLKNNIWEKRPKPRITVVQQGKKRDTYSRYKLFFPECEYQTDGLEGFLSGTKIKD